MTGITYVAMWPITDRSRPTTALIAEACRDLDIMAALAGARIVGEPTWARSLADDRLVCLAPARQWDPDEDPQRMPPGHQTPPHIADHIMRLAANGWTVRAIAEFVGVARGTAAKYASAVRGKEQP